MAVGNDMPPRIMRNVRGTPPKESDRLARRTRESSNRLPAAAESRWGVLPGTALEKAWPVTSNGEVEGPRADARLEPRAHSSYPRPRRHYRPSRPPPTIVRRPVAARTAANAPAAVEAAAATTNATVAAVSVIA